MKCPLKLSLLGLTAIAVIAGFLWMRALASWRPAKIGQVPSHYIAQHISNDGGFVLGTDMHSSVSHNYTTFDLTTGNSYKWPFEEDTEISVSVFGWAEPFYWHLHSLRATQPSTLDFIDPRTHQIKHSVRLKKPEEAERFVLKINGHMDRILTRHSLLEFDLDKDEMVSAVELKEAFQITHSALMEGDVTDRYAISSDGKTLYGSWNSVGLMWDAHTGKRLKRWQMSSLNAPWFYSPDGRVLICFHSSENAFVDSATGKTLWTTKQPNFSDLLFSQDDSEVVLPQKNNCQVRDTMTGRLLRQLPGPRSSDPYIFQVTHNFIYTQNRQGVIQRWRAR